MVTDAILDWLFSLVDWFVNGIPAPDLPAQLDFSWMMTMDYFLPLTEMFLLFLALFALGGPFIATSLIVWVLVGVLRGGATKT